VQETRPIDTTAVFTDSVQFPPTEKPITREPEIVEEEFFDAPVRSEEITTIENDVFIIELSSKGGNIHKVFLKKFKNWYSINDKGEEDYYKFSVQLINFSKGNTYDLSFVSTDGKAINTAEYFFDTDRPPGKYSLSGEDSLTIKFKFIVSDGKELVKNYTFYGNRYVINSDIELFGMAD
jgi:YidC/Oxa1 family membrane protein insertase